MIKTKKSALIFWVAIISILVYVVIHNLVEEKAVTSNPYATEAVITSIKSCGKYGRCLYFKYHYDGKEYNSRSRTDVLFSKWCKDRNGCKGLKFEITINKDNPEQLIVDWDKIFNDKEFLNNP